MNSKLVLGGRIAACTLPLLILLLLPVGCSSTPESAGESESAVATKEAGTASNRRVFGGCNPESEVKRYEGLVGKKVSVTFAWKKDVMREEVADLKVPAGVLRIESPFVAVDFDRKMPNRELYISAWIYSGHIRGLSDGAFGVDPCSASIEAGGW